MTPRVTPDEAAKEIQSVVLARYLAEFGVRNTVLENFHAGRVPYSKTGDFSDVTVVTPDGHIPWNELSRLSDPEIRTLMLAIEKGLARVCSIILKSERSGELDRLVEDIRERSFGEQGVSWDIPEAQWQQRQAFWNSQEGEDAG